MKGNHN